MHIFLTGPIQIGKSTAIRRTLARFPGAVRGFQTYFTGDRTDPFRRLYLADINAPQVTDEALAVVRFTDGMPQPDAARFDALGPPLLRAAGPDRPSLLVMDECGRLERDALQFQRAILNALDGDIPVLGVVRHGASGWTEAIRIHPGVRLITVSLDNRNDLPAYITACLCG